MTRVSDHALLRYLERGAGIEVEAIRLDIARRLDRAEATAAAIGVQTYAVQLDGLSFIVRTGTVTTVLPALADGRRFHALGPRER